MKTETIILRIIAILAFVSAWVYVLTRPALIDGFNFSDTGEIGDTIGGLTAPIIGIVGTLLVYYSFQAQLKANKLQYKALVDERKRFETTRWLDTAQARLSIIENNFDNLELHFPMDEEGMGNKDFLNSEYKIFKGFTATTVWVYIVKSQMPINQFQTMALDIMISYFLENLQRLEELVKDSITSLTKYESESALILKQCTFMYLQRIRPTIISFQDLISDVFIREELDRIFNYFQENLKE
jgi:hypothetical protein